jgi:asparagine synthase (glutamine-hydrolysing)
MIFEEIYGAMERRIPTDPDVGFEFLVSGGLDSAISFAVSCDIITAWNVRPEIHANTIGMDGATDVPFAISVIKYCRKTYPNLVIHHHIIHITKEECLERYKMITYITESYDITTNRASTVQSLCVEKIKERNPNCRVLIVGDFSDEVCSGYLYFHKAPDTMASHNENILLCNENYLYDLTRVEKCCNYYSVEPRSPFTCYTFYELYLSIPPKYRDCIGNKIEKELLRNAFREFLPDNVLWRQKEAFSDGVSSNEDSWFKTIQKFAKEENSKMTTQLDTSLLKKPLPYDDESLYIRNQYWQYYPKQEYLEHYWTTKWSEKNVVSARELTDVYNA